MKVTSVRAPSAPFEITNEDGYSAVFYENVIESKETDGMTGQEITVWDYEKYTLPVNNSPNLYASIETNLDEWMQKAKDYELDQESAKIRAYRDKLLNDCDLYYCNAEKWANMADDKKSAWAAYKQSLRDVPGQNGFPYQVIFPVMPELNRWEEYE